MNNSQNKSQITEMERLFKEAIELRDIGNLEGASKLLLSMMKMYPDVPAIYLVSGGIYKNLEQLDEAVSCFRKAVQLEPKSELASLGVFHCLWQKEEYDDALHEMRRFLEAGGKSKDYDDIIQELREKNLLPKDFPF